MAEKVTKKMVLNTADLECYSCYKEVKKILCKFPQIRDQVYDVKNSKVTIKVLCCNPEKIRDKLCCKGGKVIKSIQIVDDPPKTKVIEKPKEEEKIVDDPPKPKEEEKIKTPDEKSKDPEDTIPHFGPIYPNGTCCGSCSRGYGGGPCYQGHGRPVPPPPGPNRTCCVSCSLGYGGGPCYQGHGRPVPPPPGPNRTCCGSCSQGYGGGPCYQGFGRPVPPPPGPNRTCCGSCSQGYGGGPCYQGHERPDPPPPGPCYDYERSVPPPADPCYDYGYGYRGSKCRVNTDCFSEENPHGCTIM